MGVFASPTEQQARLSKSATVEGRGRRTSESIREQAGEEQSAEECFENGGLANKGSTPLTTAKSHHLPEKQRIERERDRRVSWGDGAGRRGEKRSFGIIFQGIFSAPSFSRAFGSLPWLLVRPSRRHGRCRFPSDKGTFDVGGPVDAILLLRSTL